MRVWGSLAGKTRVKSGALVASVLVLSGCGTPPGPSVPFLAGSNIATARAAVQSCAVYAPRGGRNAVTGSYVAGVVLGGIIVGPIIVASNENDIRADGEAAAVDRCLAKQGYVRRDLTEAEMLALNNASGAQRQRMLDHLVNGGKLETLG